MTPQIRTVATSPALHISCQGHLIRSSRSNSVAGFQTVFSTTIAHNLGARCLPAGGQTELYTLQRSANSPEQFWVLHKPGWAIPVLTIPCTVQALGEVCRMAEACSHVSLVNQASWKQLEADSRISSQLLGEGDAPLVSLQTDLRHMGIEPPVQISLWPNKPPPLLASGRAPGSTIKGVFCKA